MAADGTVSQAVFSPTVGQHPTPSVAGVQLLSNSRPWVATHPCVPTTTGWEIFTNGSVLSTLTTIAHSHTPHTELALIVKAI